MAGMPPGAPSLNPQSRGGRTMAGVPPGIPRGIHPPFAPLTEGCDRGVYGGDPRGGCGGVHGGEFLIPEHAFANGNACPGMRNH